MLGLHPDSFTQCNHRVISLQKKCIEPLGESKSDYDIFAGLAERMGVGPVFTDGGKTDLDWVKQVFHATDLPKHVTWEEFEKKGYFVVPMDKPEITPAMRWFAEGRKKDTQDWGPRPRTSRWPSKDWRPPCGQDRIRGTSLNASIRTMPSARR